jgi:tetratricopeptide (TPR) repeat protein
MSWMYTALGIHGYAAPTEVYPRAMAAARKALELDDTLADAHANLANCLGLLNWDTAGAERELQRSRDLNPELAIGVTYSSLAQAVRGRFDEAIVRAKRAVELAPTDFFPTYVLGVVHLYRRQFDKAIEWLRKATEIDPGSPIAHSVLAHAHAASGQRERAIEESDVALALSRRATVPLLRKADIHAILGEIEEARGILEEVKKKWKPDGASSLWIAVVHASLGEKDAAFEWLEKAFQERVAFLIFLKALYLGNLHGDPRFDDLVKRIGIPD